MKIVLLDITPLWLGVIRMGMTSAVLFAVLALSGRLRTPNRQDVPVLISVGVFMFGVYTILTMIGLSHAQAGRAAILTFVTPLWVTPLAIVILGERLSRLKAAGLVFAVGGLGVLFNPLGFDWSRTDVVIGNGLLLLASMSWATTIIHLRTHRWRLSPLELGPWQLLVATAVIAPAALWWFRWGAMATIVTGLILAWMNGYLVDAIAIGLTDGGASTPIGIGMWLGTIMWFNVWFVIWPNQKKALGMVEASADEIGKAKRIAFLASRTNTMLSIPMMMSMVGAHHGFFM